MFLSETEVFRRAISDYGKVPQKIKAIEELAELINAISIGNPSMIAEEMADVSIMMSQLELIYNNSTEVEGYKKDRMRKPARQIRPIEELSKLIQIIAKGSNLCLIAEKIADTYFLLDHLKKIYVNEQEVKLYRDEKLERLNLRLLRLEEVSKDEGEVSIVRY
jgi:hypothetical protein